jgi:hypothetical protein
MTKREEVDSYLSKANIYTYREWVAGVVGLEVSELTTDSWNKRSSVEKRRVAAYILRAAAGLVIRDIAIVMKKSEPWVTKSTHYIQDRLNHRRAFRDTIERMTAEWNKLTDRT